MKLKSLSLNYLILYVYFATGGSKKWCAHFRTRRILVTCSGILRKFVFVIKYEKWAKLVRACSTTFLSNLLHVRLAVLSIMGKKGFAHRSFLESNTFDTVKFGLNTPTFFFELRTICEHLTLRTVRSWHCSNGQL